MNRNQDLAVFERDWGIRFEGAMEFLKPEYKHNFQLAMDAQPLLVTTPNTGIPAFLTTFVDPDLLRILLAKNAAVEILGEVKKGSFTDVTVVFPVVEMTGDVSAYGDFSQNGRAGANMNFPQRESFLYQNIIEYGELELERAGLAKIGWASELKQSSISALNKFQNWSYFYGVSGLQNYGLLNDPGLQPFIAPAPKAAGGLTWWNGNFIQATANEIYADIQALFGQLVNQSLGLVSVDSKLVLALSPHSETALTTTNTFNVNVVDLLKKNFKNLRVQSAVQYGAITAANPQGSAAGEIMQLIAEDVESQKTGFCAFNEKLRAGVVIRALSSFSQKMVQRTWGAVIRQPFAIAQMIGI